MKLTWWQREPAVITLILGLIANGAVSLGLVSTTDVSAAEGSAVGGALALVQIIGGILTRSGVYAPTTVRGIIADNDLTVQRVYELHNQLEGTVADLATRVNAGQVIAEPVTIAEPEPLESSDTGSVLEGTTEGTTDDRTDREVPAGSHGYPGSGL